MRYAVLGGSFNPVHVGHLFLADAVLTGLGYDRIILVPAFQSPFKIGAESPSPQDRMEMLAASIPGDPRLTIDDCEIRRQGVSFTVDTLKDIIARYRPEGKPGLILGDDLASDFGKWKSPDEIAGILGHEVGHIKRGHYNKGVQRHIGWSVLGGVLGISVFSGEGIGELASVFGRLVEEGSAS